MLFLIKKSFKVVLGVIASIAIAALATVGIVKYNKYKHDKKLVADFTNGTGIEQLREKYGKNGELPKAVLQTIYKAELHKRIAENDDTKTERIAMLNDKIANVEHELNKMKSNVEQRPVLEYELGSLRLALKIEKEPELQNLIDNNSATRIFHDLGFSAREAKLAGSKDVSIFLAYNAEKFREEYGNEQGVLPTGLLKDIFSTLYNIDMHYHPYKEFNERFARLCLDRGFTEEEIIQAGCDPTSVSFVVQFLERFTRRDCR